MEHFRVKHFAAMLLIGDGVLALMRPEYDAQAWKVGPASWQNSMKWLRKHPALAQAIGVAEIAMGVTWVLCAERNTTRFLNPTIEEQAADALVR